MKHNFRHTINMHQSPVSDGLFDAIVLKRKERKTKPFIYWTMVGLIFSVLTASSIYFNEFANQTFFPQLSTVQKENSNTVHQLTTRSYDAVHTTDTKLINTNTNPINTNTHLSLIQQPTSSPTNKTITPHSHTSQLTAFQSITTARPTPIVLPKTAILRPLAPKKLYPSIKNIIAQPSILKTKLGPGDCYSFSGRQRGPTTVFIDLLGSPDIIKPSFTAKTTEMASYLEVRQKTETPVLSYSTQLGIGIQTPKGFILRTGINYSSYDSRFRKKEPNYTQVIIKQIFDNNGNLIGLDTVTSVGSLDVQHFNKHQYIGIPLTLGYTTSGNRLDIGVNFGLQFNIKTISEGRMLNSSQKITNFSTLQKSKKPIYKNQIGLQAIANLTFAYEIGEHFDLILAPHIKYTPNNITNKPYPLSEKLLTTGIWLGGRIRF